MRKHLFLFSKNYKNTYLYGATLLIKKLICHLQGQLWKTVKENERGFVSLVLDLTEIKTNKYTVVILLW